MKVSILGTNGFLSTEIASYCNKKRWTLDMYGLSKPTGISYRFFYKINLLDDEINALSLLDSDIIVYAIGAGIQSNLNEGSRQIYNLNVSAPVTLCNNLKKMGYAGIFVTFGSYFEIGETPENRDFDEYDVLSSCYPAPNDYAVSKRMLSRYVSSYSHDFIHWHFILPTIYGENENPQRLIPYTVAAILHNSALYLTSGEQVRQYIHVSEIPKIMEAAYRKSLVSGIYNIQGCETLAVKDIVSMIYDSFGKVVPPNCFGTTNRQDIRMKHLALDGSKLYKVIGFKPNIKIKDVIESYKMDRKSINWHFKECT